MKNLKFLTVALALLSGIVLTSCNTKSNDNSTVRTAIVQTSVNGSFVDIDGTKLIPTNPAQNITADMVYIYCRVNGEQPANAQAISITLLADPVKLDEQSHVFDSPNGTGDVKGNTSLRALSVDNGSYTTTPYLFNQETLILPIGFFLQEGLTNATLPAEIDKHKFELVYYADSATPGDTEMKIYLRHTVEDPATPRERQWSWTYKAYNISAMLNRFKSVTSGINPTRIVIYFQENRNSDKLDDATERTTPLQYSSTL